MNPPARALVVFFFNDTATTEIYTLSLHDALPIVLPAEVSVITPVAALYAPAMLPIVAGSLVNDSTSCPETKLPLIDTVALGKVGLSRSATVSAALIADAAPFSV